MRPKYMFLITLFFLISHISSAQFIDFPIPKIGISNEAYDLDTINLRGKVKSLTVFHGEFKDRTYEFDKQNRLTSYTSYSPTGKVEIEMHYTFEKDQWTLLLYGNWHPTKPAIEFINKLDKAGRIVNTTRLNYQKLHSNIHKTNTKFTYDEKLGLIYAITHTQQKEGEEFVLSQADTTRYWIENDIQVKEVNVHTFNTIWVKDISDYKTDHKIRKYVTGVNKQGQLISKMELQSHLDQFIKVYDYKYEYDEHGNLITEFHGVRAFVTHSYNDKNQLINRAGRLYTYNDNGRIETLIWRNGNYYSVKLSAEFDKHDNYTVIHEIRNGEVLPDRTYIYD